MTRPRLILADDHRVFVEGLTRLLSEDYEVVCLVEDGVALLEAVERHSPDLVISDLSMPRLNGIEVVRELRQKLPDLPVVLLTMHEDPGLAKVALQAGAAGFVLKHSGSSDLLQAVEQALAGRRHLSARIASSTQDEPVIETGQDAELTPRQLDVLRLLVDGLSAKEVAARLSLSVRTVESHKYQAMERIGVKTSAELVAYAVRHGIGPI